MSFGPNTPIIWAFQTTSGSNERMTYSPFRLKLETFLRIHRVGYAVRLGDFISRPLPWMVYNGKLYENVDEAIAAISIKNGIGMDLHLRPSEKATARAFQIMLEHRLYWLVLLDRWLHQGGQFMQDALLSSSKGWLPRLFSRWSLANVSAKMKAMAMAQGYGSAYLDKDKVAKDVFNELTLIEDFLHNKTFFMGEEVSLIDCTAFALLRSLDPDLLNEFPRLKGYVERMLSLYFPETDDKSFAINK